MKKQKPSIMSLWVSIVSQNIKGHRNMPFFFNILQKLPKILDIKQTTDYNIIIKLAENLR